ncbi:MAG: D-2-hydroxyacid dehydrogenase [Pseudomonadota bacterium]
MTIVILSDVAEAAAEQVGTRHPGERIIPVSTPDGLPAALAENPDIGFSIHSPKLPAAIHRQLVNAPSLRWVQIGGSGYEHLTPFPDGLAVTNGAGVLAPFLAETTIGALLALNCNLVRYQDASRARRWQPMTFRPLAGQRLAVVGTGAIGQQVALRARQLGMQVIGLNRAGSPVDDVPEARPLAALDAVLAEVDAVSVHLRLTPETTGLFNAERFGHMRPGALFLNSARGRVVVEKDLIEALRSGQVGGAWLDVFEVEPLPAESPLWTMENVLLSPHASDQVRDWEDRFAVLFADNLSRWRAGKPLLRQVAG